jgi:hypothetical protein
VTGLDVALAFASPAGSIAAAVLNGVFAYGEAALAGWRQSNVQPPKPAPAEPTATGRPQPAGGQSVAGARKTGRTENTVSVALAGHLAELRRIVAERKQSGEEPDGHFIRADVEKWLKLSPSHAKNVVAYGLEHGLVERVDGKTYRLDLERRRNEQTTG